MELVVWQGLQRASFVLVWWMKRVWGLWVYSMSMSLAKSWVHTRHHWTFASAFFTDLEEGNLVWWDKCTITWFNTKIIHWIYLTAPLKFQRGASCARRLFSECSINARVLHICATLIKMNIKCIWIFLWAARLLDWMTETTPIYSGISRPSSHIHITQLHRIV